ncbi:hypothetical protein Tco_0534184 [Tanacetum coccineum]
MGIVAVSSASCVVWKDGGESECWGGGYALIVQAELARVSKGDSWGVDDQDAEEGSVLCAPEKSGDEMRHRYPDRAGYGGESLG